MQLTRLTGEKVSNSPLMRSGFVKPLDAPLIQKQVWCDSQVIRSASLRATLRAVSGNGDELDEEHARLHRLTTPTSLDRTIGDDDSNELVDLLPDSKPGPEAEVMSQAENEMATGLLDARPPCSLCSGAALWDH